VFCVEHGRWTGSAQFAAANTIVHPSVRESAAVDQVQTKVWDLFATAQISSASSGSRRENRPAQYSRRDRRNGRTEAYEKIYESRAVGVSIDDLSTKCSAGSTAQPWV